MANQSIFNAFERMWQHIVAKLGTKADIEDVANLYVWEKYDTAYSIVKTEVTYQDISYKLAGSEWSEEVKYADSYEIQDNHIVLINPTTVILNNDNKNVVIGKYIYTSYLKSYYEIPSTSTVSKYTGTIHESIRVNKANKITLEPIPNEAKLEYVASQSFATYPTNGTHTDGYWYKYIGQLGDTSTIVGDSTYVPKRGVDYWTAADIAEIKSYVDDAILGGAW